MRAMKMKSIERKYGWKPDIPDQRDCKFIFGEEDTRVFPSSISLRATMPSVLDQDKIGSCAENAGANLYRFVMAKLKKPDMMPSRLFWYYNVRVMEDTVAEDAGSQIRDVLKSLAKLGVCDEKNWPYTVSKFTAKPPPKCFKEALKHTAIEYKRLDSSNLRELKACLVDGYPFIIGTSIYESFESGMVTKTGRVPLPGKKEKLLGGHATLVCGYDNKSQRFEVENSWNTTWGDKGYFTIPYEYLINSDLASDFWTLRSAL